MVRFSCNTIYFENFKHTIGATRAYNYPLTKWLKIHYSLCLRMLDIFRYLSIITWRYQNIPVNTNNMLLLYKALFTYIPAQETIPTFVNKRFSENCFNDTPKSPAYGTASACDNKPTFSTKRYALRTRYGFLLYSLGIFTMLLPWGDFCLAKMPTVIMA